MRYYGMDKQYDHMIVSNLRKAGNQSFWRQSNHQFFPIVRSPDGATVGSQNSTLLLSPKLIQYFISDISVSIVHVEWNKGDVQIEIHTESPFE